MKVKKIDGVSGFMPTTYAVYFGGFVIAIFLSLKDANEFIKNTSYEKARLMAIKSSKECTQC